MTTATGGRRIGDAVLTLAAAGGVVCIALVLAASVFHITLIMFKTGSMSPTIPAGSLALVREIPAAEARVGDVLTISRPGDLPITHRVTSVAPLAGGLTSITMKGDANDFADPAPYSVSSARIVLYSIPGLATAVIAVSHPVVLASITLGAAVLVGWAFWPRGRGAAVPAHGRRRLPPESRTGGGRRHRTGRGRGAGAAGAGLAVLALAVTSAVAAPVSGARAATTGAAASTVDAGSGMTETTVSGRYLTLVSIHDAQQSGSLSPGRPVPWQVGVTVRAPEPGTVHVGLSAEGELTDPGELSLDVRACPERWVDGECARGELLWLPRQDLATAVAPVPASMANPEGAREIGRMQAETSWLMLRVVMPVSLEPGSAASLRLHAWGAGDVVALGDSGAGANGSVAAGVLAFTGFRGGLLIALAVATLATGVAFSAAAKRRRRSRG